MPACLNDFAIVKVSAGQRKQSSCAWKKKPGCQFMNTSTLVSASFEIASSRGGNDCCVIGLSVIGSRRLARDFVASIIAIWFKNKRVRQMRFALSPGCGRLI